MQGVAGPSPAVRILVFNAYIPFSAAFEDAVDPAGTAQSKAESRAGFHSTAR